jgi:hypothetical protein
MKYVYILCLVISGLAGLYVGYRLAPGSGVREVVVGPTVEKEIVRTVTRTEPGKTVVVTEVKERVVTKAATVTKSAPQASTSPQAQYRAALHIRPTQAELSEVRVSVGRRLVGGVWLEAGYFPKRNEITAGISYEF